MTVSGARTTAIVLALGNVTEINGLLPYVKPLAERAKVHVLFESLSDTLLYGSRVASLANVSVVEPEADINPLVFGLFAAVSRLPAGKVRASLLGQGVRVFRKLRSLLNPNALPTMLRWSRQFLSDCRPCAVITGSDRDLGRRVSLLKQANDLGVPVVVLPAAFPGLLISLLELRGGPEYRFTADDPALKRHPHHFVRDSDGGWIGYFPDTVYGSKFDRLGLVGGNPWVMGGVWAQKLLCQSRNIAEQQLEAGLQAERIRVVGSLELDHLADQMENRAQRRAAMLERLNRGNGDSSFVIGWAMHQYAEHGMCSRERSQSMMNDIACALMQPDSVVLASLHPKMDKKDYAWIEQLSDRIVIVPERLETWLGVCDLSVASGYSSTIGWSSAIGIPSLVYDFLDFRDTIYDRLRSVRICYNLDDFTAMLRSAASQGHAWKEWQATALTEREYCGVLDGQSFNRIAAEIGLVH